jgi:hypothetical protein
MTLDLRVDITQVAPERSNDKDGRRMFYGTKGLKEKTDTAKQWRTKRMVREQPLCVGTWAACGFQSKSFV